MKSKFTLLFAFCLSTFFTSAQVEDVLTGLDLPFGIATHGNEIFYSENGTNTISKFDASLPNPTPESLVTGLVETRGLLVIDNELYFIDDDKIKKFNVADANPTPVTVVSGLDTPTGLAFYNGELYVSSEFGDAIVKFNISQANPAVSTVVNQNLFGPQDIAIKDGIIYIAEFEDGQISKVDLNAANPVVEEVVAATNAVGVFLDGDYLYYTHGESAGKVSRIKTSDSNPTAEDLASGLDKPRLGTFYNGEFYVALRGGNKIVKLTSIAPVFSSPDLGTICVMAMHTQYGGASPIGGIYSGEGVLSGGNGETFTFDPALAGIGTHSITYTALNGLTTSSSITVIEGPNVMISQTQITCNGANNGVAIASANNSTYLWSTGATTASISSLSPGIYTVTATNSNGCTASTSVTFEEPDDLAVFSTGVTNVSCNDGNDGNIAVTAFGGTGVYTYTWSSGTPPTMAGTYSVTVTDGNGCTNSLTETITQPDVLVLTTTGVTNVSCNGGNDGNIAVTASGGTPLYSYIWSNGTPPNMAGTYSVTVTDFNGCTNSLTETITEPTALTISTSSTPDDGTSNGTATAEGMGGTPFYSYNWSNGGMTETIENLASGIYEITITDANNCTSTASIEVENNEPLDGDECTNLIDINNLFGQLPNEPQVSATYNLTNYGTDATDMGGSCFADGGVLSNTIWFSFTGDGAAYNIKTIQCMAGDLIFDAQMIIFSGDCGNLTEVACNDDEDYGQSLFNANLDFETEDGVDYMIMIDVFQGSPISDFCLQVTAAEPDAVTNITETNIEIFPNPTTGELQLLNVDADQITIFDNVGKLVLAIDNPNSRIDISALPVGFYFLKIMEGKESYSAKVVKE